MVKIIIDCDQTQVYKAIYVFKHIFLSCGIQYRIELGKKLNSLLSENNELNIYYGDAKSSIRRKNNLVCIPVFNYSDWFRIEKIKVKFIDDIPTLYVNQEPLYLIENDCFGFDIVNATFFLLSRQEEKTTRDKDMWGRFPSSKSILKKLGLLDYPVINCYIKLFKEYIVNWYRTRNIQLSQRPVWKDNKDFAVALTHDGDLLSKYNLNYGISLLKNAPNENFQGLKHGLIQIGGFLLRKLIHKPDPNWGLEDWINLEKSFNMKSSFYFFSKIENPHIYDVTYNFQEKIKFENNISSLQSIFNLIAEKGWEVSLHGSINSFKYKEILNAEKQAFEEILKSRICGNRQHYLRFDAKVTWKILEELGFLYDSSLGYNDEIGYRAGIGFPFYPFDQKNKSAMNILELPLTVMDEVLFRQDYYNLSISQATKMCIKLIDDIENLNGLIVFLWHTHAKNGRKYYRHWEVYKNLLEYLTTKNCWVTSAVEIAKWWHQKALNYDERN